MSEQVETVSLDVLLRSDLITNEETYPLVGAFSHRPQLTAREIIALDLPAKVRVEALLQYEFLTENQLQELSCEFAKHTLYVFEEHAPEDRRLHLCLDVARLYFQGLIKRQRLEEAISTAIPAKGQFLGTKYVGAFEAADAILWLNCNDAALMARQVAFCAQRAAHRKEWESRTSDVEPMMGREREAAWQLALIAERLALVFYSPS